MSDTAEIKQNKRKRIKKDSCDALLFFFFFSTVPCLGWVNKRCGGVDNAEPGEKITSLLPRKTESRGACSAGCLWPRIARRSPACFTIWLQKGPVLSMGFVGALPSEQTWRSSPGFPSRFGTPRKYAPSYIQQPSAERLSGTRHQNDAVREISRDTWRALGAERTADNNRRGVL